MPTEFRVISESEGHITEYSTREQAESRADDFNNDSGLPSDHYVEKHTEDY